jgi:ribosomal protein L37E
MNSEFSRLTYGLMSSPPRRWPWMLLAVGILLLDYISGPYLQFPILFIVPVVLATWGDSRRWGFAVAIGMPLVRLGFAAHWNSPDLLPLEVIDQMLDALILSGLVLVTDRLVLQERRIRVLQGMLPICGFCKRIRTEDRSWQQLEQFITDNSEAKFSHTFCPECGERHYGGYLQ